MKNLSWPPHLRIYEINTWPWLNELSRKYGKEITLNNIPSELFTTELNYFDCIWLMGVWTRSPEGKKIAQTQTDLLRDYRNTLSDFQLSDVVGSPYAIYNYEVDPHLGGKEGLQTFREQLQKSGKLLILDFVPNHVAVDHPWTSSHPEFFIRGHEADLKNDPEKFYKIEGHIYAHGKDPYFSAWTDTAQLNAFSAPLRQAVISTLKDIARVCDGVRCDMAMLMENEVFRRTWGNHVEQALENQYWIDVIQGVRTDFPEFHFLAEVYWDMEWTLQQFGFNYCYDKRLYDRLQNSPASEIRMHLQADWAYQRKLVRFIENHDEKRALEVFGKDKIKPASVLALTLPGAHLVHYGQCDGRYKRLPVQLSRYPKEPPRLDVQAFYNKLLSYLDPFFGKSGEWKLLPLSIESPSWMECSSISSIWTYEGTILVIFTNFSSYQIDCTLQSRYLWSNDEATSETYHFLDSCSNSSFQFPKKIVQNETIPIQLPPWGYHLLRYKKQK